MFCIFMTNPICKRMTITMFAFNILEAQMGPTRAKVSSRDPGRVGKQSSGAPETKAVQCSLIKGSNFYVRRMCTYTV